MEIYASFVFVKFTKTDNVNVVGAKLDSSKIFGLSTFYLENVFK